MKRIFSLLLFLTCAGIAAVHSQPKSGRIVEDSIYSDVLQDYRRYSVYLPAGYDRSTRDYPVLYLLHGLSDTHTMWPRRAHLREVMDLLVAGGTVCDMIIISPEAGGNIETAWNGYFDMPGWKYESFFFEEFVPYIEKLYRAGGSKGKRAVAGLSMGGGGATSYGQRHSNMFCGVYAMSALMSIPAYDMSNVSLTDKMGILTRSVIEHSCTRYVEEADNLRKDSLRTVAWFVDCGDDDFLFDRNIEFFQAMRKAGIHCELRVRDGGHDYEYWHSALYTCLPFVSRLFIKNAAR